MVNQRGWTVPCIDAVGRPREFTVRAYAVGVVLGFPPAGSAAIPPRRARALAIVLAAPDQTTAGSSGVECTAGSHGGCASKLTTHPVVPETPVGPGLAPEPAPTGHQTVGAADARSAAPTATHGWAAALTGEKAHWVPVDAPRGEHNGRPTGLTLENDDAFIDDRGFREGAELPPCLTCCRELGRLSAPSDEAQQ